MLCFAAMRPLEQEKIAVIGLGYVGLPVALSFGRKLPTVGFDIRQRRVDELKKGHDETLEVTSEQLASATKLELTADPAKLADCTFYIVAVPTPIDSNNRPDLGPMISASRTIGPHLKKGDVVVLRVDGLPGRHRGGLRPDPRREERPQERRRLLPRLLARAHQPGRQGAHVREDHEGRLGPERRRRSSASRASTARSSPPACTARRRSRSPRPRRSSRTRSAISTSR